MYVCISFIPLAIRVYRQIKNAAMVISLQDIKVTLKKVLLFHFVVTLQEIEDKIYWLDTLPCSQTTTV